MTRRGTRDRRSARDEMTAYPVSRARPLRKLRTINETADILNVSPRTVQRLVKGGKLRAHHIGPLVRIEDADIAALLDATESI